MSSTDKVNRAKQFYYSFRNNYVTFRLMILLKEKGFVKFAKTALGQYRPNSDPYTEKNLRAQNFLEENKNRIKDMLELLADDKSREVWKAVMRYRAKNTPIPSNLWSDTDQYFPRDLKNLIRIKDEVFVDGGAFIGDTIQHLFNLGGYRMYVRL